MNKINGYPDTFLKVSETSQEDMTTMPFPTPEVSTPSENGTNQGGMTEDHTPVIPLPNPGEGGPVYTPPEENAPSGNRPSGSIPPINRPSGSTPSINRPTGSTPSINRPSGSTPSFPPIFRPVFTGSGNGIIGGIAVIPGISFPCFNCTATTFGRVRVLNASTGYQPFYVYLGNWLIASQLDNGDLTSYVQSASGTQTVTVSGANGYIYIQKTIQVRSSSAATIAIINTPSGLDLMEISDLSCTAPSGSTCLRTCNLSPDLGPFDVSVDNRGGSFTAFTNVRYREVTSYSSFYPGWYQIYISRSGSVPSNAIAAASANLMADTSYTLYIFNAPTPTEGLRAMIVSN